MKRLSNFIAVFVNMKTERPKINKKEIKVVVESRLNPWDLLPAKNEIVKLQVT